MPVFLDENRQPRLVRSDCLLQNCIQLFCPGILLGTECAKWKSDREYQGENSPDLMKAHKKLHETPQHTTGESAFMQE